MSIKPIKSILIANRGEIARRVIRTAKKMGIKTVAVYSEIDADALFVKEADAKVNLGGRSPAENYLDVDKIMEAAVEHECDAIHPGYGFLSENPELVRRCEQNSITFIGPKAETMQSMGDKQQARETARKLGVPTVPGSEILQTPEEAVQAAEELGFPVLLKASAGGGGIGMKKVDDSDSLSKAFTETTDRAGAAFSDKRVYLEKYLPQPHHIEIQVFCDHQGNVLTFLERECSIQRRYQKVIEESPSSFATSELRQGLRDAARKLVQGINYINAGTIEFVVDRDRNFYFLEANTRLQVEHPATEAVTGLDLVEMQIKTASGEELPIQEQDLSFQGWAIEARIYAEDPVRFFPAPGTIKEYSEPTGVGIRVDSGYTAGDTITPFYDPLIAKLIAWGEDRQTAIERLLQALKEYHISGIKTNIPFLIKAVDSELFKEGGYDTHFVDTLTGK